MIARHTQSVPPADRDSTKKPMLAVSIITAITGAPSTPSTTALTEQHGPGKPVAELRPNPAIGGDAARVIIRGTRYQSRTKPPDQTSHMRSGNWDRKRIGRAGHYTALELSLQ